MTVASVIPGDLVASATGALLVAAIYLARAVARLSERVARLEGRDEARNKW